MIPIFDTHAHLDLEPFSNDADALRRVESGGFPDGFTPKEFENVEVELVGVLLPGIDAASSRRCVALAATSTKFHAAVAIQPNSVIRADKGDWDVIAELAGRDDVVAVGETGLDRYWDDTPFDLQVEFFRRHLELARKVDKPILIHCRDAWDDLLPILRESPPKSGVIHAFSGSSRQAEEAVRLGLAISFAGSLTYRNAKFSGLWEAARLVPADRLLVETDAPYMTPHPFRGKLPHNEPIYAAMVAQRLAELRQESLEDIAETTTGNARRILGR